MSIRSLIGIFLIGYVITSVASISICTIHGTSPCPCSNTILTSANQPSCGNGNPCIRCGGYKPSSMVYYKPSNDMYSCSTIVKPAFVPETCPCYCHVSPVQEKESHYDEPEPPKPCEHNPVDPVSLTLAKRLLDQSKDYTPESKFWYGPARIPRIDLPKIIRKNIPEERLFAMERDVIELKPRKSKWGWDDSSQEDSSSSSSSDSSSSESNDASNEIKRTELTYKEIGYDRIKMNDCKKDRKSISLLPPTSLDIRTEDERPENESCPFVPGQVVLRKTKLNPFIDGTDNYEDLADRLDSLVENSRSKFYENVINRARGWKFNGHAGF